MPRMARIVLPTYPHHVVQRGHNRQATFAEDADYERYLATLQAYKTEYRVSVFAWCLMTNHVHLLLAPEDRDGLGTLMKRLAGRQTRYYNTLERCSGTLWEGRYKSSLVQSDAYLLACCRYIELNPVRARIVVAPDAYRWSSCRQRFGQEAGTLLDEDPCYLGLSGGEAERRVRWKTYLRGAIPADEWTLIRSAVHRGQLTGDNRFTEEVASIIGRRVERRGCGRPAKTDHPSTVTGRK